MLNKEVLTILLIGPSGSGKGTQAELLSQKYGLMHFQSGEVLREIAAVQDDFGRKVSESMHSGFVPSEWILEIIEKTFGNLEPEQSVVIDGFSRKLPEIKTLISTLAKAGRKIDFIFLFEIGDDVAESRLLKRRVCPGCKKVLTDNHSGPCPVCGEGIVVRSDDNKASIKKRLEDYKSETVPVINFLEENGFHIVEVNAEKSVLEIFQELCANIEKDNKKI